MNANENAIIEISGFIETSIADGPGVRSVLFLQGCTIKCQGCHNEKIWAHGQGIKLPIFQVMHFVNEHCYNRKITISGGEPLEQMEELYKLISMLWDVDYNICLYTSFQLKDIPENLLAKLNYIKTGKFEESLKTHDIQYFGSINQKFFKVNHLEKGAILCKEIAI